MRRREEEALTGDVPRTSEAPRTLIQPTIALSWQGGALPASPASLTLTRIFVRTPNAVDDGTEVRFAGQLRSGGEGGGAHGTGTVACTIADGEDLDGEPGPGLVVRIRELVLVEAAPASVVPPPPRPIPARSRAVPVTACASRRAGVARCPLPGPVC